MNDNFQNFGMSAQLLFFSAISSTKYKTFQGASLFSWQTHAFFVIFLFLFNFILLKMLVSIVILRYRTIRSSKLLEIQARARIISMDAKNFRKRIYNTLCSRCKKQDRNGRKMKCMEVVKYYITELCKSQPYKSKDYFEKQLKKAREELIKEKAEMTARFQLNYSFKKIDTHKQNVLKMCFYLFYVILFVTVVSLQLSLQTTFGMKSVQDLIKSKEMLYNSEFMSPETSMNNDTYKFNDIVTTNQVIDWMDQIVISNLLNNTELVNSNNYAFDNPRLRISITKLKLNKNNYKYTEDVFPTYVYGNYHDINKHFGNSVQNTSDYDNFEYKEYGNKNTPNFRGGYIIDFSPDENLIMLQFSEFKQFIKDSHSWAVIFIELLHYNRNTDMVIK